MDKIILIDGDILNYQIAFSVESPIYVAAGGIYKKRGNAENAAKKKGVEVFKRKNIGSFEQARFNLNTKLKMIFDDLGTHNYKMYLTGKTNYRHEIATFLPYKGNRVQEKPFYHSKIRDVLVKDYKALVVEGQEADDAIGIEQYKLYKETGSFEHSYIATIDKDLRILEGNHYHMNNRSITYVSHDEGMKRFYQQMLKGDGTDNIPGLTKLLKLKGRTEEANALSYTRPGYLKEYEQYCVDHTSDECYNEVIRLYKKYGIEDKEIREIGALLWIRRQENELWQLKNI